MSNYLELPQHRPRGTASRDNYVKRYEQAEFEWRPVDDDDDDDDDRNDEVQDTAPVPPPPVVSRNEEQQQQQQQLAVSFDRNSIRPRRRKKRKKISHNASSENEFLFGQAAAAAATAVDGTTSRPQNDAKRTTSESKSSVSMEEATTKTKDTPMPETASMPLVSPEDEVTAPATPQKAKSPHGKRVLDVEYSPIGSKIYTSVGGEPDSDEDVPSSKENEEWVEKLTSNAMHTESPRPYDAAGGEATNNEPDELPSKSLAELVEDGSVVTRQVFFSRSSFSPMPMMYDLPLSTKVFKGQVGSSPLHWWQATVGTGKNLFMTFEPDGRDWRSEGRRQLEWEANVLDWIQRRKGGRQLESFPKPLWLQATSENDSHVLCLSLTSERESSVQHEVLGTLEDLMHMHARYNNGPIPEPLIAQLVLEVLRCVETLHQSGVTHDNLGLDSFLLVRRKQAPSKGKDGAKDVWFLVCTGLGSEAKVFQPSNVTIEAAQDGGDDAGWRFKHDLYSIANIAHLLLSGGIPLSWKRDVSGLIDVQSKDTYLNLYLRGKLAWEELFQSLLNPPNASCGMHFAEDEPWTHAYEMVEYLTSKKDETELRYLDCLMEHVLHERAAVPLSISAANRFVVKLVGNPLEGESESSRSSLAQQKSHARPDTPREFELLAELEEKKQDIATLREFMKKELQEAINHCNEQRSAKEAFQQLVEYTRQQLNETVERSRHNEEIFFMQQRGFMAAMNDKDRALENLRRRDLGQRTVRNGTELQDAVRRHRSEIRAADERIVELQAENVGLKARLEAVEKRLMGTETEKKQLEELQEGARTTNIEQEKQLHGAQERIHSLEATLNQSNDERLQDNERLKSAQALIDIQKLRLRTVSERATQNNTATVATLQRNHDEAMRQLKEKHQAESESQRKQLAELQAQLSDETEERRQAESRIKDIQEELSRSKSSKEEQSKLHNETEARLKDKIDRLERQVRVSSTMEADSQETENGPKKRIQALETAERRRSDEAQRAHQPRETAAIAHRQSSASGSSRRSVSSQASHGSTTQNASSRLHQATALSIPGMSLTSAGAPPPNASPRRNVPPADVSTSDSSRMSNGRVIVFGDPYTSDSDSDSHCSV